MENKIASVKEIKRLYVTKEGLPKKECLLSRDEVNKQPGIKIPEDIPIASYVNQRTSITLNQTGKYFKGHHCNWITPKIGKFVYYGFTKNEDHLDNSDMRFRARLNVARRLHGQQATLISDQKQGLTITHVLEIE